MDIIKEIRMAVARIGGQKMLAFKLNISESDLTRKLNGQRGWKLEELQNVFNICGLKICSDPNDDDELDSTYFLSKKLTEALAQVRTLKGKGGDVR